MSPVGEAFTAAFGPPDQRLTAGFSFPGLVAQMTWENIWKEVGAGWFLNRFMYLFGPEITSYDKLLETWSFLLPPVNERIVLGRNVYGALLMLENASTSGVASPVRLLDPLMVRYWGDENLLFVNSIGHWLPQNKIPHFLDRDIYDKWFDETKKHLADDEILAIKVPLSLGGTMTPENFQVENIFDYYKTTGAIYTKTRGK